jgi:glycosyltransferase involved in cell wall biosynthesis
MKNATIILLCNQPWDWSADYCRQTALVLAKQNNILCYLALEPIRFRQIFSSPYPVVKKQSQRLWFYHPVQLCPLQRFAIVQLINERLNILLVTAFVCLAGWCKVKRKIIWVFDQMFSRFITYVPKSYRVLYDCVDYIWDSNADVTRKYLESELTLIRKSTWMVVNSESLYALYHTVRSDIHIVPQGFSMNYLQNSRISKKTRSVKPTIGFVGVIDNRIDFTLLFALAQCNPQWHFEIWGRVLRQGPESPIDGHMMQLRRLPNVTYSWTDKRKIGSIITKFDVGIIPYNCNNKGVKYCYPMKLFEYFYFGKPVVSTPIEELRRFPIYVKLSSSLEGWEQNIELLLSKPWPGSYKTKQRELARENSWEKKVDAIISHL